MPLLYFREECWAAQSLFSETSSLRHLQQHLNWKSNFFYLPQFDKLAKNAFYRESRKSRQGKALETRLKRVYSHNPFVMRSRLRLIKKTLRFCGEILYAGRDSLAITATLCWANSLLPWSLNWSAGLKWSAVIQPKIVHLSRNFQEKSDHRIFSALFRKIYVRYPFGPQFLHRYWLFCALVISLLRGMWCFVVKSTGHVMFCDEGHWPCDVLVWGLLAMLFFVVRATGHVMFCGRATGHVMFWCEGHWPCDVLRWGTLVMWCFGVRATGHVMFCGEGHWPCDVLWWGPLVMWCSVMRATGHVMFCGEGHWSCDVLWWGPLAMWCFVVRATGHVMFRGEGHWPCDVLWLGPLAMWCFVVKATGHVMFCGEGQ